MAVQTKTKSKLPASAASAVSAVATAVAATTDTLLLSLTMYSRYNRDGVTYEKGKVYRFPEDVATRYLKEADEGRPIWRSVPDDSAAGVTVFEGVQEPVQEEPVVAATAATEEPTAVAGVELATADEEAELGLPAIEGTEQATEGDASEGEQAVTM